MSEELVFLILSIAMLAVGPVLYRWLGSHKRAGGALDSFILFSVGALICGVVLPDVVAAAGVAAVACAITGFLGPLALERLTGHGSTRVHQVALALGVLGLVFHTALDGAAIAGGDQTHAMELALAVSLHRLPVGMTVWALVRPKFGVPRALGVLGLIAAGTVAGFVYADLQIGTTQGVWFACFQAFVAGSLMHVLVHHDREPSGDKWKLSEVAGGAVGIALVFGLTHVHDHSGHAHESLVSDAFASFMDLALTSAAPLLAGYILAGVAVGFLPRASLSWTSKGSRLTQSTRGMLFGVPIPICSCGVVPVYQSLVRRGVPAPAAMAFLVATPELEIGAIMLSLPLLGAELTAARLVAAMGVAVLVGTIIGGFVADSDRDQETEPDTEGEPRGTIKARAKRAVVFGLREVVDDTAPWILVGLAIAAIVVSAGAPSWFSALPEGLDVVFFAALGLPIYVCASGATPLAAALIFAGASPGAAIAFLLSGPASNVTTLGVLSKLHSRRVAAFFGVGVVALAVFAGYAINLVSPKVVELTSDQLATFGHDSWWQWASLIVLIGLFAVSLLRRGPRDWLDTVVQFGEHHHHDHHDHDHDHHHHDHGHDHDHDHGHHHDHDYDDHDHHDHH
jgi:hypothetical protein